MSAAALAAKSLMFISTPQMCSERISPADDQLVTPMVLTMSEVMPGRANIPPATVLKLREALRGAYSKGVVQ